MDNFLRKLNRIFAYLLLPLFILLMVTGYRQVGYFTFLTRGMANALHQIYINISFLVLFTAHALISIRFALARNRVKGLYLDILLLVTGVVFIGGFAYFALALR
ncbi:MAG: hypothetical protein ACQEP5_07625 [Actinomycetota bacterium]